MPDPVRDPWTQLLGWLGSFIIPDWEALVRLLPLGLLVIVLAVCAGLARRWMRFFAGERARLGGRAGRRRRPGPLDRLPPVAHRLGLVPLGGIVAAAGLVLAPAPAVANLPLLLAGLVVAVGGAAAAIAEWERPDAPPTSTSGQAGFGLARGAARVWALILGLPRPLRRLLLVSLGALVAGAGLVLLPAGDGPHGAPAVANLPLLLAGLAIGLAVAAASVRDWEGL